MIVIFLICSGLGHAATVQIVRELINSHRPRYFFLSEVKISDISRIGSIVKFLYFDEFFVVPSHGSAGGLIFM